MAYGKQAAAAGTATARTYVERIGRAGLVQASSAELPLAPASVHSIIVSPPYWGYREYAGRQVIAWPAIDYMPAPASRPEWQPSIHVPAQRCALGAEDHPEEFVAHLVHVCRELRRVLRDDGTLWLNLADRFVDRELVATAWPVALALQADGWLLASDVIWFKSTPMPDPAPRPSKSHEYIFLLSKTDRYYYDVDGRREEPAGYDRKGGSAPWTANSGHTNGVGSDSFHQMSADGRQLRDVWTIRPGNWPGAHFATFPPDLPARAIELGTSEAGVCSACGAPWTRIVEKRFVPQEDVADSPALTRDPAGMDPTNGWAGSPRGRVERVTVGWQPTCDHLDAPLQPAIVLDTFTGSGTTVREAARLGRRGLGLDLAHEYLTEQARPRLAGRRQKKRRAAPRAQLPLFERRSQ